MPHVSFVPFSGTRVREAELLELGMTLPGLQPRANAIAELPALGLLTIAGLLPDHWSCSYHPVCKWDELLVERILAERPEFVAVSALTASIEEAYAFSTRIRRERIPTVIGGLHASCCANEAHQYFDAVVVGSGESVWPQVVADAESNALRPFYQGTPPASAADWPLPRFDLLPPGSARFTLQTQRGCPLSCQFCGASRLLGPFCEKPVENIRRELAAICAIAPDPLLELADDNTFAGFRDVEPLLDCLQNSRVRYFTEADWRIGTRPELLRRLAKSGCVQVLMGIESLVFRYPGMGQKQAELDRIVDAAVAVQEAGVAVNGCVIVGADGETRASLERLVQFLLECPLADVQITLQTPFPGTELYRKLARQGRLLPDRGWSHYTLFDVTYRPSDLTVAELEQGFRDVLRNVFSRDASQTRERRRKQIWGRNARLRP